MIEPKSPLPWTLVDVTKKKDYYYSDGSYEVTFNTDKSWNIVMDDQTYYNSAPDLQDAEYIVQAANSFPEAVRLLKESVEVLKFMGNATGGRVPNSYVNLTTDLNQFLTKLEEDENIK